MQYKLKWVYKFTVQINSKTEETILDDEKRHLESSLENNHGPFMTQLRGSTFLVDGS